MGLDNDSIYQIFNQAAEEGRAQRENEKPTLGKIWNLVADKFTADSSFKLFKYGSEERPAISIAAGGNSIQIEYKGNDTYCLNRDQQETHNESTPEEVVAALGRFYGEFKGTAKVVRTRVPTLCKKLP